MHAAHHMKKKMIKTAQQAASKRQLIINLQNEISDMDVICEGVEEDVTHRPLPD